jgi:diguanylate cyclase (GGDEF)-like protein
MRRSRISSKFFLALAAVVPMMVGIAWVGASGLTAMHRAADAVYKDNFHAAQVTSGVADALATAEATSLQSISSSDPAARRAAARRLTVEVVPRVATGLSAMHDLHHGGGGAHEQRLKELETLWRRFLDLETQRFGSVAGDLDRTNEVVAALEPARRIGEGLVAVEAREAGQAHAASEASYRNGRRTIVVMLLLALAVGIATVTLLIRDVVPRVRRYSALATAVAAGDLSERVEARGHDELADLGHALNDMVSRRVSVVGHESAQAEFVDMLQVTQGEDEAHDLLKRHVERSIAGSTVVVLNRNNSADRLEATTDVPASSPLAESLLDAKPRSCLAVRFARTHTRGPTQEALVSCELCGKSAAEITCEPLLVGGEVIGSVHVDHPRPLGESESGAIKQSVAQAAPVLANLRNLAIAELRAATDALTGLPNNRAMQDTLKRMAAHASRSVDPLTAVMLDLDHFKAINDAFGHSRGDDVLAAVGAVLRSTLRESDFVGRYGGEEFVALLPSTGVDEGLLVAEKLRTAIAALEVPGVERTITVSLGVAVLPNHAGDAATLIRCADRALYQAKRAGRDRVERAMATTPAEQPPPAADPRS